MDTIRIKIPNDKFLIKDPAFFNEVKSSHFTNSPRFKVEKTNNGFRNEQSKKGFYAPKFKLLDMLFGIADNHLVVEFSAPKLLYGTNLKEVTEADLPEIITKLKLYLKSIGIGIFEKNLENATVTLVAYAKNIPISHLGKTTEVLRVLLPFDYRPRSEFRFTYKQDNSHAELKYFNNNTHLVLYDKLAELLGKPITDEEKKIADYYKKGVIPPEYESIITETLRFELTLHTKFAVKQVMEKHYGRKNDYTLSEVFKDKIRDEALKAEVSNIFNHPLKEIVLLRSYDQTTFNKIIDQLCKNFSQSAELRTMFDIIYTRGIGELRKEVTSKSSKRTWFRKKQKIKQLLKEIDLPPPQGNIDNAKVIEYILSQFGIEPNIREPKQLEIFT